jgi:hypothetical protein
MPSFTIAPVSFDPNNPRGTPPPAPPPAGKPQPSFVPPQPVNSGPSRTLIAVAAVIVVLLLAIVVLIALNVLKTPSATPGPSSSPALGSSALPTSAGSPGAGSRPSGVPPTAPASGPPTPLASFVAPSPGTPEAALLAHVPEALRTTCSTAAGQDPITVSASCSASDGTISVIYDQYADAASMAAAYAAAVSDAQIDSDSGSCEDHTTWPAEGSYDVEGAPTGRRLCIDKDGAPTISWTDERLNILSQASGAANDVAALIDFWTNEAGPIP